MASSSKDPTLGRRLRITYVMQAAWFVILAGLVAVVAGNVAAGGLTIGLMGLGFVGGVLVMGPDFIPSGDLDPSVRRVLRVGAAISVLLVIATIVLVGAHARPIVSLVVGIAAAAASMGVSLWAVLRTAPADRA